MIIGNAESWILNADIVELRVRAEPLPENARRTNRVDQTRRDLVDVHRRQRSMAVAVRLDFVTGGDERGDELRERLGNPALDEECALDPVFVQDLQHPVDIAHDTFRDRRVVVDARLVPVFYVYGERMPRRGGVVR